MKRTIKFRGKTKSGKFFYGNYARFKYTSDDAEGDFIVDKHGDGFLVQSDSVAQLVGYDANGREVYEGDTLINENGDEFCAALVPAVITDEGFQHDDIPIEIFTLKKDSAP